VRRSRSLQIFAAPRVDLTDLTGYTTSDAIVDASQVGQCYVCDWRAYPLRVRELEHVQRRERAHGTRPRILTAPIQIGMLIPMLRLGRLRLTRL
jgi:hypothetical protein